MATFVAVDLGATSGRVVLADVRGGRAGERLALHEVHRFTNGAVRLPDGLHWNAVGLFGDVVRGLRAAARYAAEHGLTPPASIGIDSWAVDYGLLDGDGGLLGEPFCYRDGRTARGVERVHARLPHEALYGLNGLQHLPFTTLYQLATEPPGRLDVARHLLMIPDLVAYWLTGAVGAELTNASTTGLLDVRDGTWSEDVLDLLEQEVGFRRELLPPLRAPGGEIGTLLPHVAAEAGLPASTPVVAIGSHDTASAVAAVPASGSRFAYVSSGTWSLVGLEVAVPVLSADSRRANFTNEGGVDGTVRYLRNVGGLWLLSESLREWSRQAAQAGDPAPRLQDLLADAARVPAGGPVFDVDDPVFLPPGDMPSRIGDACTRAGVRIPADRPSLVRSVLDSLAAAYARTLADAAELSGRPVDVVHVVGGGVRNTLLCRLTARACGLPVLAGPVEATALGNVLVQARAAGELEGDLAALRGLVLRTQRLRRYEP